MVLPGRVPRYKRTDVQLLPSSTGSSSREFHDASGLLHLHSVVAGAVALHRSDEAHDRPLLAVSAQQLHHQQAL